MSITHNSILRKIMEKVCRVASKINPIIPKSSDRILFYESTPDFMNNFELMKYMIDNKYDEKYNIYYFPDIRSKCNLGEKYHRIKFSSNIAKAFMLFLTSKFVFLDTGNMRMKPSKNQTVLYMDHGLPFKWAGIGRDTASIPLDMLMPVTSFLSTSSQFDKMYRDCYCLNQNQLIRCGRPRTDAFYKKDSHLSEIGIDVEKYSKIIIWMTTYRIPKDMRCVDTNNSNWSSTELPILTDMSKINSINKYLREIGYLLVIKIHASSVFNENSITNLSNVKLIQDEDFASKGLQIYDLIKDFDCLITDYSSVFMDYSITEKPMIFITDDFEEFNQLRGFFFDDPLSFLPGPKVNNYDELLGAISSIDINEKEYASERKQVKDFCHYFQDGKDSERLLKILGVSI